MTLLQDVQDYIAAGIPGVQFTVANIAEDLGCFIEQDHIVLESKSWAYVRGAVLSRYDTQRLCFEYVMVTRYVDDEWSYPEYDVYDVVPKEVVITTWERP